jgi:hypothetical protein
MPATTGIGKCRSCGGAHTLCLRDADLFDCKDYEYQCPRTGEAVLFKPGDDSEEVVPACPPGAVAVRLA